MDQIHKRLITWQVKVMFKEYCQGLLDRPLIEEILGIGRSRFFALLNKYLYDIRGCLIKRDIRVSSPIIITRAKSLGCYQPYLKRTYSTYGKNER